MERQTIRGHALGVVLPIARGPDPGRARSVLLSRQRWSFGRVADGRVTGWLMVLRRAAQRRGRIIGVRFR